MKKYFLPILLTLMFVTLSVGGVDAQSTSGSISGDDVCGATTACSLTDVGTVTKKLITLVISLGLPLLIVFIAVRVAMAEIAVRRGDPGARKEALKKAANAIVGFLFIVALFGGLLFTVLKMFGVDPQYLKFFQFMSDASLFPHAYAQSQLLPNPTPGITSLYDFIIAVLKLVMRFFVYPALIVIWVWTGFAFVAAQGNPEGLSKAKKWLVGAFITTLIIFMLQMFLVALRGTVQQILPGQTLEVTKPTLAIK